MEGRFVRQRDLAPRKLLSAVVIGAGGIGGATSLALAKMGTKRLSIFDPDLVERHNQPNQIYGLRDVGYFKIEMLRRILLDLADARASYYKEEVSENTPLSGTVVLSCVDSIESRRKILKAALRSGRPRFLVDGRVGGEVIELHQCNLLSIGSVQAYSKTLEVNPIHVPCTRAAIIDGMLAIAALMARAYRMICQTKRVEKPLKYDHRNLMILR